MQVLCLFEFRVCVCVCVIASACSMQMCSTAGDKRADRKENEETATLGGGLSFMRADV